MKEDKRFKYNMKLEHALRQVYGKKYYGYAGCFENATCVKKAIKDWTKKIRKRIIEVTEYDLRLRSMALLELEAIERRVEKIKKENNDWEIISTLMNFVSRLLGYDWLDGEIHRQTLFFQSNPQEWSDKIKKGGYKGLKESMETQSKVYTAEIETIKFLENKGLTTHEISCVLKISESTINRMKKQTTNKEQYKKSSNKFSTENSTTDETREY